MRHVFDVHLCVSHRLSVVRLTENMLYSTTNTLICASIRIHCQTKSLGSPIVQNIWFWFALLLKKSPFRNALAGVSQTKQRIRTVIRWLLIEIPFSSKWFISSTNRFKYSFKSFGFVSPHHIAISIGWICGSSTKINKSLFKKSNICWSIEC